jgi:hypothetical protein
VHSSKFEGGLITADSPGKEIYLFFTENMLSLQAAIASTALKTLISLSTVVLLGLILAYHSLEVQVRLKYA